MIFFKQLSKNIIPYHTTKYLQLCVNFNQKKMLFTRRLHILIFIKINHFRRIANTNLKSSEVGQNNIVHT